ncbi:Uncharacterised protein [Bordetella pertussis]|nr:Uncharacterised protein [Bordetella pertussis]
MSSFMMVAYSCGEFVFGVAPSSLSRLLTCGLCTTSCTVLFSFCTTSAGVPAGANRPNQVTTSKSG